MVIDDFNIVRAIRFPAETNAPLIIDADGVLAFAGAMENFQTVAGWDAKVNEFGDGVELGEFAQCNALDIRRQ